jgi:hypothetical protein
MATPRRRFTPSPAPPERLPLDVVLDGPRPGRDDPARDGLWLTLRAEIDRAACGGPYDPRRVMALPAARLADWRDRRAVWAAALLADDPRVEATWRE